jgi:hypothetical protein
MGINQKGITMFKLKNDVTKQKNQHTILGKKDDERNQNK